MAYFRCIGNDKYVNFKQGTFTSSPNQYGIVDVNVGFRPDLIIVRLPFSNGDTVAYWDKDFSYGETQTLWSIVPEGSVIRVNLDRTTGETGIQAINNDGFSFLSFSPNTRNVECYYTAVKYEKAPAPEAKLEFFSCCNFGTGGGFILPYTINADYKVTVEFYESNYHNDSAVIGNTSGASYSHLTEYINKWFTSSGSSETNFGSWVGNVAHTFINNNGNSKNEFDEVEVTNYTPTNSNYYYTIGCRGIVTSNKYLEYIKYYKIESISTGNIICELKPAKFTYNDIVMKQGLFDVINEVWYDNGTMTVDNSH